MPLGKKLRGGGDYNQIVEYVNRLNERQLSMIKQLIKQSERDVNEINNKTVRRVNELQRYVQDKFRNVDNHRRKNSNKSELKYEIRREFKMELRGELNSLRREIAEIERKLSRNINSIQNTQRRSYLSVSGARRKYTRKPKPRKPKTRKPKPRKPKRKSCL